MFFTSDLFFEEETVLTTGDELLHFNFIVERDLSVFNKAREHAVMLILVPVFDKGEISLCRSPLDEFVWFIQ